MHKRPVFLAGQSLSNSSSSSAQLVRFRVQSQLWDVYMVEGVSPRSWGGGVEGSRGAWGLWAGGEAGVQGVREGWHWELAACESDSMGIRQKQVCAALSHYYRGHSIVQW